MKTISIVQSNYIPWKGYFDLISASDEFIIYDSVQYTRRDWRNRNIIKTPTGGQWLTVPIKSKGKYLQAVQDTEIYDKKWAEIHWKALDLNYKKAPCFDEVAEIIYPIYIGNSHTNLSKLNTMFIKAICNYLGISTVITNSAQFDLMGDKTDKLVQMCKYVGATQYISGPSAKKYIEIEKFFDNKIGVTWFDYDNYPEYPQQWGSFIHPVSILDLLFNCGKNAPCYMKCVLR